MVPFTQITITIAALIYIYKEVKEYIEYRRILKSLKMIEELRNKIAGHGIGVWGDEGYTPEAIWSTWNKDVKKTTKKIVKGKKVLKSKTKSK